jgi:hypothetical protein
MASLVTGSVTACRSLRQIDRVPPLTYAAVLPPAMNANRLYPLSLAPKFRSACWYSKILHKIYLDS